MKVLFVISNTRLQQWRSLHTWLVVLFFRVFESTLGCKAPLNAYRVGGFQETGEKFSCCESLCLQWQVFYCELCLSYFAPGSLYICKALGAADTEVLVENHHVSLSSKRSCCACVKSFFCEIETYFNARLVMSSVCVADVINSFSWFSGFFFISKAMLTISFTF